MALSLAEKTVKNYVTAVLGKLGMESRTQAAVFAVTHGQQPPSRHRPDHLPEPHVREGLRVRTAGSDSVDR